MTSHGEMRAVLHGGVQPGADRSKLPDDGLVRLREAGDDRPRCGHIIARKTAGSRTSYHCPEHQEGQR